MTVLPSCNTFLFMCEVSFLFFCKAFLPGPLALCRINAAASAPKTSVGGLAARNNSISATGVEEGEYISKTATVFDGGEDFHHFRDEANPSIDRMSLSPCSGLGVCPRCSCARCSKNFECAEWLNGREFRSCVRVYCRGTVTCHEGACLHLGECQDLLFNKSRPSEVQKAERERQKLLLQRPNCSCDVPVVTPAMTIVTVLTWRRSSFCLLSVETLVGDGLVFNVPPVGIALVVMCGLAYYFRNGPIPNLLRLWPRLHERDQR